MTEGTNVAALSWNSRYMLTEVKVDGAVAESYQYDALGRRAVIATGSSTNYLIYDGYEVIAETDESGNLLKSYTWGPDSAGSRQAGIDNLLSFTTYDTATNTYYAVKDHLGSVTALLDENGQIVESYTYDAFGNTKVFTNGSLAQASTLGNRYTFQGREISWASGLINFRSRWYDPVTGRWVSKDKIGIAGGHNLYAACRNNPINYFDFSGHCEKQIIVTHRISIVFLAELNFMTLWAVGRVLVRKSVQITALMS